MYKYEFTAAALREFKKLPKNIQTRIIQKLEFYLMQANPVEFADLLIDSRIGQYRFRIGDYRVIFDLEEDVLVVISVGRRREIYR